MVLLAAFLATVCYCQAQSPLSAVSSGVRWSIESDTIATVDAKEQAEVVLSRLEPNATIVYTDALEFKLLLNSLQSLVKLEIASVNDRNGIIWGIRFYVFKSGPNATTLTLVEGGSIVVDNTDGNPAICSVGYRNTDAYLGYGSTTLPVDSEPFTGINSTAYTITVEVYGRDGIQSTEAATLQLGLVWS